MVGRGLVHEVLTVDKHLFDAPTGLLFPRRLATLAALVWKLRAAKFDEVVVLHHFVTRWGRLKFGLLSLATGAKRRRGLDNGHGWFLTDAVTDPGFGVRHESDYWSALLGGSTEAEPVIDLDSARSLLAREGVAERYVVVHPGSGSYSLARRWPGERFGAAIDGLFGHYGLKSVVVGGADETELAAALVRGREAIALSVAGRTDLATLAGLLKGTALFVGNDGGVAQLAAQLRTPSVVIFGPSNHRTWGPRHPASRVVRLDLPCSPCFYRFHELGTPEGCATRECLLDLGADRVLAAADDVLRERNAA